MDLSRRDFFGVLALPLVRMPSPPVPIAKAGDVIPLSMVFTHVTPEWRLLVDGVPVLPGTPIFHGQSLSVESLEMFHAGQAPISVSFDEVAIRG